MSGIAGILAESRPDRALLSAMAHRLAHRGGHGAEPYLDGNIGLVRTGDRATQTFPLRSADGRLLLIADGTLTNAAALAARLGADAGEYANDPPDADRETHAWRLAFAAWRVHGPDFIRLLEGDFALALWDSEAASLVLARDRPGARPLCFVRTPYGLAFASEPKGLLPALGNPAIEPRALARFVQGRFVAGELTLFAGVERVAPGAALVFDVAGHIESHAPPSARTGLSSRLRDGDAARECASLARRILHETAASALLLDGPAAALLLAFADGEAAPRRIWTIAAKDGAAGNAFAAHFPIRHAERITVDAADLIWRLPEAAWACDEPVWDPRLPAWLAVAEAAAAQEECLLFSTGAAESLGGAARYHRPRMQRWVDRLLHPDSGGLPGPGEFHGQERALFGPTLHRAAVHWRAPWIEAWTRHRHESGDVTRLQSMDADLRVPGRMLAPIDRAAMAHGVRWRAPWLDARMIAFGLALPERLKSSRGGGFLQRRLRESLPPGLASAPPLPSVPLAAWLSGSTLDRFEKVLSDSPALHYWFQPQTVHSLVAMKRQGKAVTARLGLLLTFALWHRIWIEGEDQRPPLCDPLDFLEGSDSGRRA